MTAGILVVFGVFCICLVAVVIAVWSDGEGSDNRRRAMREYRRLMRDAVKASKKGQHGLARSHEDAAIRILEATYPDRKGTR